MGLTEIQTQELADDLCSLLLKEEVGLLLLTDDDYMVHRDFMCLQTLNIQDKIKNHISVKL